MMNNKNEVKPTVTLAKMHENQGNYREALKIYKELNRDEADEFIQKKIDYLMEIIQSKNKKEDNEIKSYLLSPSEKEMFQIKSKRSTTSSSPQTQDDEISKIFGNNSGLSNIFGDRFAKMTLEQFMQSLIGILGKNRRIKDVSLAELINAIERI